MKIIFSGGGTLGPVTPLLAIYDTIKEKYPEARFLWVGTKFGPERELVEQKGIPFSTLSSGKFRRYISIWNIVDIFRVIIGFFQSIKIVWKEDPDICISAGGFISVPLHWTAWLFGVRTWIHQQDVRVGLANKLMAPFAKIITVVLEKNKNSFSKRKTYWLGNPVREEILNGSRKRAIKDFNLNPNLPLVFATGGGTGSLRINQLIVEAVYHLKGVCQIIHLSGKERPQELVDRAVKHFDYYQVHHFFLKEMKDAYAVADIIISRGGFGTLTEIAALGKPAIIIPKPGHQDENVRFLANSNSIILIDERTSDGHYLAKIIKDLLQNESKKEKLSIQLQKMLPIAPKQEVLRIVEKLLE